MTVFIISPEDKQHLLDAVDKAKKNPISWELLQTALVLKNQETDRLTLADRELGAVVPRQREEVILPFGWRVCITCEEQPAGRLLHLSMSSPKKGKIPNEHAMQMVIESCGFSMDDVERGWLEEFEPGWSAINVLIFLERRMQ